MFHPVSDQLTNSPKSQPDNNPSLSGACPDFSEDCGDAMYDHTANEKINPATVPRRCRTRSCSCDAERIAPLVNDVHTFTENLQNAGTLNKAAQLALRQLECPDEPLVLVDLGQVRQQFLKWKQHLPDIQPHYAVKCNPDQKILQMLIKCGASFDCATAAEIDLVTSLGVAPERIVYSHPCKPRSHLRHASKAGVRLMSFDNESELLKISKEFPNARLLLRLVCEDSHAQCPMSMKFGASRDQWAGLLDLAKDLGLVVAGVSFHVGSGCKEPTSFEVALRDAKDVFALAAQRGFEPHTLDVGGGFPGMDTAEVQFETIAATIKTQLGRFFAPADFPDLRVIAEPGRFFAHSSSTLLTKVYAKMKIEDGEDSTFRYYLNDGLYGSFNCVIYDHAEVHPEVLEPKDGPLRKCCLFGPTCDGFDVIIKQHEMPELMEGDYLVWRDMGAYTSAAASRFNGFPTARFWYYWSTMEAEFMDGR